jgi:hypothetical protein
MATLNFPSSPSNGDIHTHDGKQWQYVSADTKWIAYGASLAPDVLKVDAANNRVGINQTTPAYSLDVTGTTRVTGLITASGGITGTASLASLATEVTVSANNSTNETTYPTFVDGATSAQGIETDTGLTYNPSTGALVAAAFTGLASTAPVLSPGANINGTAFTGAGNIVVTAAAGTLTGATLNSSVTASSLTTVGTLTGLTVEGTVDMVDGTGAGRHEELQGPKIKDYAETVNAIGATGGGTQDIDLKLGNVVTATVDTSTNTFTFTAPPTSGIATSFTLFLTNGGSQTVAWPSGVDWAGGTAPTLTSSGVDILTFTTVDAGTIWYGFAAGLAMA